MKNKQEASLKDLTELVDFLDKCIRKLESTRDKLVEEKPLEYKGEAEFYVFVFGEVLTQVFNGLRMQHEDGPWIWPHNSSDHKKVTPILKPIPEGTEMKDLVGKWVVGNEKDNKPYLVYEKNKAIYYNSEADRLQFFHFVDISGLHSNHDIYTLELP